MFCLHAVVLGSVAKTQCLLEPSFTKLQKKKLKLSHFSLPFTLHASLSSNLLGHSAKLLVFSMGNYILDRKMFLVCRKNIIQIYLSTA